MRCEHCNEVFVGSVVILPLAQPNGNLITMTCVACAEKTNVYCTKHARPHLAFDNSKSACMFCIEEEVHRRSSDARIIFKSLREKLPSEQYAVLRARAIQASVATGNKISVSVLRFIVCTAQQYNQTLEQTIDEIIAQGSVDSII